MEKMMNKTTIMIFIIFFFYFCYSEESLNRKKELPYLFVGVLEESSIRVLFYKENLKWNSVITNDEMEKFFDYKKNCWGIVFNGSKLGDVVTTGIKPYKYDYEKRLLDTEKYEHGMIDFFKNSNKTHNSWRNEKIPNPPVALSKINDKIQKKWMGYKPTAKETENLIKNFRKKVKNVYMCDKKTGEIVDKDWNYENKDIDIKGYSMPAESTKIFRVELNIDLYNCDGPPSNNWNTYWFRIQGNNNLLIIPSKWDKSEFIDAGDYDNNGKLEFLFWGNSYNKDGYILFYNNFNNHVEYFWHYH